jgi:DNA (cytosine-5)-methyltransferase 1
MAEAAIWSDVTTFDGRPWRGLVDGVIGGIPCQPHSLAGKRQGSDDERDLWSDARRIIVQSGAWFVLIENVSRHALGEARPRSGRATGPA